MMTTVSSHTTMAPPAHKNGHRNRLWDEIATYVRCSYAGLTEYVDEFITEQTEVILKKMYENENDHPEDDDPEMTSGCYYRPFIAKYGSVYHDFIDSAHPWG